MNKIKMISDCSFLVSNLDDMQVAKTKLCATQKVIAAFDLTIPPISKEGSPSIAQIEFSNSVEYGAQHARAADICEKIYTARHYYSGNKITFVTVNEHAEVITHTYTKLVDAFNTFWQIHRLQKRYFGRLEFHRKSFIDGMADEIESIIDMNLEKSVFVPSVTHCVAGMEVTGCDFVTVKESLKPLTDFVEEQYKEISVDFDFTNRKHYFVDYHEGRAAGKQAYKMVFAEEAK